MDISGYQNLLCSEVVTRRKAVSLGVEADGNLNCRFRRQYGLFSLRRFDFVSTQQPTSELCAANPSAVRQG
jgi:hypothetical protein